MPFFTWKTAIWWAGDGTADCACGGIGGGAAGGGHGPSIICRGPFCPMRSCSCVDTGTARNCPRP